MQEKKKLGTEVVFGTREEVEKRRQQARQFRNLPERRYMTADEYETVRNLIDLMFMEGLPEGFIEEILQKETDNASLLTLDFLHCAALLMGCDYVTGKIQGQTISMEDAVDSMRREIQGLQLAPFREIYENLDEKIAAALKGETMVEHQLKLLQVQNEHLEEMYRERLESAKTRFNYQLRLSVEKAKARETLDAQQLQTLKEKLEVMDSAGLQKVAALSDQLRKAEEEKLALQTGNETLKKEKKSLQMENETLKEEKKSLQMENETLKEEKKSLQMENETLKEEKKTLQEANGTLKRENQSLQEINNSLKEENRILQENNRRMHTEMTVLKQQAEMRRRWFRSAGIKKEETEKAPEKGTAAENAPEKETAETAVVASPVTEAPKEARPDTKEQKAEDRREFCLRTLRDRNYSEEQMDLILKLMMDEKIPKETLIYICNPALPVYNMKALVRYLERGDTSGNEEEK